ncbi:DUF3781 domain-containing protein [Streptococcus constellatus]|uniref:DUF3781 domain-containing protein n=1 Tax=Streptococcus constellatus TaxID=76860 RepID=UPI0021B3DF05|nr:DUF3781 domain-containing protein [Streptococcus constellatus]
MREENPVVWAKGFIQRSETTISHNRKNFYVADDDHILLTISASSYTIITGHRK